MLQENPKYVKYKDIEQLENIFIKTDIDEDGLITVDELKYLLTQIGIFNFERVLVMITTQITQIFTKYNIISESTVNLKEFQDMYNEYLNII